MPSEGTPRVQTGEKPAFHDLHQSVVTIKVGPEKHPFVVHKERLGYYSSYFKAALTGHFAEASEGVVDLPDLDAETFKIFERWLYTEKFRKEEADGTGMGWGVLCRVYVLADRLGVTLLMNLVVSSMIEKRFKDKSSPLQEVCYVYENTPQESSLRRLVVDIVAFDALPESLEDLIEELPKEFIGQVALTNTRRLPTRLLGEVAPFEENVCQYHQHASKNEPCRTQRISKG